MDVAAEVFHEEGGRIPEHLARKAIVYLRQSSEKQVRQNKDSQNLQYAVAERVRALGWKQVEIINTDLGSSAGITSAQREGFERVLSSVALGVHWKRGAPAQLPMERPRSATETATPMEALGSFAGWPFATATTRLPPC
jgi:Resolvase, N terminal domain